MTTSPNLGLSYLAASQAQKEVTHNEALSELDALVQLSVISRALSAPPASPADGDVYIVAASPTGAWAGHAGELALYYSGWLFKAPKAGWLAFSRAEGRLLVYAGTAWTPLVAAYGQASLTWNPGTLAAGAGATSSPVAVSGAAFGDFVHVAAPYDLQGVLAVAYVSSAGNVSVRLQNQTGASVTLASGSWNVRVQKA